jgi:nanoRNase/pAp phosphatase (c-di-AMP/oligoRNAs hydrolase)
LAAEKRKISEKQNLRRLGRVLRGHKSLVIASHNNPDPDAIVSALLLKTLLRRAFGVSTTLTYSGVIGRAENSKLVEYAGADFRLLSEVDIDKHDGVALVDTQPGTGNHRFARAERVVLVFDHHRRRPQTNDVPFCDIRTHLGATTTLLYLYWQAAGIPVSRRHATMTLYALGSETADMGREASAVDRDVYKALYANADLKALSGIMNAKVRQVYFRTLYTALRRSKIYGSIVVTRLGKLPYPDVVAQIADEFLKLEGARYIVALGTYKGTLLMSLRAENPEAHLGRIARRIVAEHGSAGGHGSAAGGQIDVRGKSSRYVEKAEDTVVRGLLAELGHKGKRFRSMI